MEEKRTVIEKKSIGISAPKKFFMGDPYYKKMLNDESITRKKYNSLVFSRRFKEQFLIAICEIEKARVEYEYKGMPLDYTEINVNIIMSNDLRLVKAIEDGKMYSHQKVKIKEIGVDTATLAMETNKGYDEIKTGTDGYIGAVTEYKNSTNIEAIQIELGLDGELFDIKDVESIIKYLF